MEEDEVADLNTIFYDKPKKRIAQRTEKKVDTGGNKGVMVTKKIVVHGNNKYLIQMEKVGVALSLATEDNVDKIMTELEQSKKKIAQMKETLKRERGEGQSLKRKHEEMLNKIENLKEACQNLQSDKDALVLSVNIIEGEKKYLEKQIIEAV